MLRKLWLKIALKYQEINTRKEIKSLMRIYNDRMMKGERI